MSYNAYLTTKMTAISLIIYLLFGFFCELSITYCGPTPDPQK